MSSKLTIDEYFQQVLKILNPAEIRIERIRKARDAIDSAFVNDKRIYSYNQQQAPFLTASYARNTIIIKPINKKVPIQAESKSNTITWFQKGART